jgi:hypothetical protein
MQTAYSNEKSMWCSQSSGRVCACSCSPHLRVRQFLVNGPSGRLVRCRKQELRVSLPISTGHWALVLVAWKIRSTGTPSACTKTTGHLFLWLVRLRSTGTPSACTKTTGYLFLWLVRFRSTGTPSVCTKIYWALVLVACKIQKHGNSECLYQDYWALVLVACKIQKHRKSNSLDDNLLRTLIHLSLDSASSILFSTGDITGRSLAQSIKCRQTPKFIASEQKEKVFQSHACCGLEKEIHGRTHQ